MCKVQQRGESSALLPCQTENRFACNQNAFYFPHPQTCFVSLNLLPLICLTDIDRPKGLTFTEVDVDSIKIAWESPQGQVTRYRVTYSSPEDGIHELLPAPGGEEDTAELHGLRPGSEYTINIVAIYDDMESLPLTGTQSTGTAPTTPSRPWQQPPRVTCASMCNWCSVPGRPQGQPRGWDCSWGMA